MPYALAIQEHLLSGVTTLERWQHAKDLGFDGIEIFADGFDERVLDIAEAIDSTGVRLAGVHCGEIASYVSPNPQVRDVAVEQFRQIMNNAHDLMCDRVLFLPEFLADGETERVEVTQLHGLLVGFMRVVNDLATALDVEMCLLPVSSRHARAINTLKEAFDCLAEMRFHPAVKLALNTVIHRGEIWQSLSAYGEHVGYIQVAEDSPLLPLNKPQVAQLSETVYQGWVTLADDTPYHAFHEATPSDEAIRTSVANLRAVLGISG